MNRTGMLVLIFTIGEPPTSWISNAPPAGHFPLRIHRTAVSLSALKSSTFSLLYTPHGYLSNRYARRVSFRNAILLGIKTTMVAPRQVFVRDRLRRGQVRALRRNGVLFLNRFDLVHGHDLAGRPCRYSNAAPNL